MTTQRSDSNSPEIRALDGQIQQAEAAGRHAIADQVSHARDEGIQAWGWLPSQKGANGLAETPQVQDQITQGSAKVRETLDKVGQQIVPTINIKLGFLL